MVSFKEGMVHTGVALARWEFLGDRVEQRQNDVVACACCDVAELGKIHI